MTKAKIYRHRKVCIKIRLHERTLRCLSTLFAKELHRSRKNRQRVKFGHRGILFLSDQNIPVHYYRPERFDLIPGLKSQ